VELLPQPGRGQAHHDAGQHPVVDDRVLAAFRRGTQDQRRHDLENVGQDKEADDGGQRR
jgi:hypothetical protein